MPGRTVIVTVDIIAVRPGVTRCPDTTTRTSCLLSEKDEIYHPLVIIFTKDEPAVFVGCEENDDE